MEGNYPVILGKETVGKVQILRQGLYYRFICRCKLSSGILCRLVVFFGDKQVNLGIMVPVEKGFGLDTRIPAKRIGQGLPEFRLVPKHETSGTLFVPITPEEPFAYLSRLKEAYLSKQEGKIGIVLKQVHIP